MERALLTGEDHTTPCLSIALELCEQGDGHRELSRMPESYWQEAARQLGF
jgi:hypothetical protein